MQLIYYDSSILLSRKNFDENFWLTRIDQVTSIKTFDRYQELLTYLLNRYLRLEHRTSKRN